MEIFTSRPLVLYVTFSRMLRMSDSRFCSISNSILVTMDEYFSPSLRADSSGLLHDSGVCVCVLPQWLELSSDWYCEWSVNFRFCSLSSSSWVILFCDDWLSTVCPSDSFSSLVSSVSSLLGTGEGKSYGADTECVLRRGVRGTRGRLTSFG